MEELEMILRQHAARYPNMQPTDAVKLIYQNEFGGGHLIKEEQACLNYLRREYALVEKNTAIPLYEQIGNGIIRVNLAAVPEGDLDQLGERFIHSAAAHKGDPKRFQRKLSVLTQLTAQGLFAFSAEELKAYLAAYERAGCPAVSHSEQYRDAYNPSYRVVLAKED